MSNSLTISKVLSIDQRKKFKYICFNLSRILVIKIAFSNWRYICDVEIYYEFEMCLTILSMHIFKCDKFRRHWDFWDNVIKQLPILKTHQLIKIFLNLSHLKNNPAICCFNAKAQLMILFQRDVKIWFGINLIRKIKKFTNYNQSLVFRSFRIKFQRNLIFEWSMINWIF